MANNPYPGTTFDKTNNRWKARITSNGRTKSLGTYATQAEAFAAVEEARYAPVPTAPLFQPELPPLKLVSPKKNTKVAQHNLLVETRLPLSLIEARLFVLMLRCLHKNDENTPSIVVSVDELFPGVRGGHNYTVLREAVKHFMEIRIELPVTNNQTDLRAINLVQAMELNAEQGIVVGLFSQLALPYLTKLTDNFTVGEVNELMSLKSATSHRFYWLMMSWGFRSPITVSIERLRELTIEAGTYTQYSDYRNKVLHPSIDELNGLNFKIAFTEKRKGRAVDSVEFKIDYQEAKPQLAIASPVKSVPKEQLTPLQEKVSTRLGKLKLTEAQVRKVLQIVTTDAELTKLLKETFPILRDFETKTKPGENVAAATMALLKSTFPAIWAAN